MASDPRQKGARSLSEQRILRKRGGLGPDGVEQSKAEDDRRDEEVSTIAGPTGLRGPAGGSGVVTSPATNPPPATVSPDRLHKDAPNYVVISHDHPLGEDPVLNPGYAVVGHASSIADGYARAVYHQRLKSTVGRTVLWIWGGYWKEALIIRDQGIDVLGSNMPVIVGNSVILGNTTQCRIEGCELWSLNQNPALTNLPGLEWAPVDGVVVRQTQPQNGLANIQIVECNIHAPGRAFYNQRRVYLDNCHFWQDQDQENDPTSETATVRFEASPADTWVSLANNCKFEAWRGQEANIYNNYHGYAITGTAKIGGGVNGGYFLGDKYSESEDEYTMSRSGIWLQNCAVFGGAICEGWNMVFTGGTQYGGPSAPDVRSSIFATLRGWWGVNDGTAFIPAQIQIRSAVTSAFFLAQFVNDPQQTNIANVFGGTFWFDLSEHTCPGTSAPPESPFIVNGGTARARGTGSMTPSTAWPTSGMSECTFINSTDGTQIIGAGGNPNLQLLDLLLQ